MGRSKNKLKKPIIHLVRKQERRPDSSRLTAFMRSLRHGMTVYYVHAFPYDRPGWIDEIRLAGPIREYRSALGLDCLAGSLVASHYPIKGKRHVRDTFFLGNIEGGKAFTYNCHRIFTSRKKAESYLKMVESGCNVLGQYARQRLPEVFFDEYDIDDDALDAYFEAEQAKAEAMEAFAS